MDAIVVLFASFLAAFVPTCIYVLLAYWLDRYEKEPLWLLTVTFFWGAIPAIIVSLVVELVLDIPIQVLATGQSADLLGGTFVAPVVEELAKAVPLVTIFWLYRREFDGLMDGLIYGALVGFGFSMSENIFYFLGAYVEGGWDDWGILVLLRGLVFGLNHALFTSAFGVGLAYARYARGSRARSLAPLAGLTGAVALHMIHNFFVSLPTAGLFCLVSLATDWLGVLAWLVLVLLATRQEKKWIIEELRDEVADGLLSLEHAHAASRYRTRLRDRWDVLREHGFGRAHRLSLLHNAAAELALKKRQLRLHGDEWGNTAEIARLRQQIAQLVGVHRYVK
ncbi:MAG: PrsW family intramembrane metalloprotease [Ardenticatenaceae bacterium]